MSERTTICEDYLKDRGGSVIEFRMDLAQGWRIGQSFFNALSGIDQERLRGTIYDCFNAYSTNKVYNAIAWLLDTEDKDRVETLMLEARDQ